MQCLKACANLIMVTRKFPHCPKGVYFIVIIKKPCLRNGNRPITKMGLAHAFEQFGNRIFLYSLSTFEFTHYFLQKLIMLIMKTEKHPVAMQICITQDFSLFFFNIWVYALFLRKAYNVDNQDWKTSCTNANIYCDLKFAQMNI